MLDGFKMAEPLSKAKLSVFRKLHSKKNREIENRFIIEGWHLLEEAIKSGAHLNAVVYDGSRKLSDEDRVVLAKATQHSDKVYSASESQLKALGETKTNSGVIGIADRLHYDWGSVRSLSQDKSPRDYLVALDAVSDPGNCGAIVRGCDWFGADAVLMGKGCPEKENGKLVRATMGGLFHLPILPVENLAGTAGSLKGEGFQVVASEIGASGSLFDFRWPAKTLLVIGNEARGVSEQIMELADHRIQIPSFGNGESLNAAMSCSVFLGHWRMVDSTTLG
jgi:TrmH family RNA methyltransferase